MLAFSKFSLGYKKSRSCLIEHELNKENTQECKNSGPVNSACVCRGVGVVASRGLCYEEQNATFLPLLLPPIETKLLKQESRKLCLQTKVRIQHCLASYPI